MPRVIDRLCVNHRARTDPGRSPHRDWAEILRQCDDESGEILSPACIDARRD